MDAMLEHPEVALGRSVYEWLRKQAEDLLVAVGRWVARAASQNAGAQSVRRS